MKNESTISRAEHLAWCKQRALEYVDAGDVAQAFASLASDLNKHPGTSGKWKKSYVTFNYCPFCGKKNGGPMEEHK